MFKRKAIKSASACRAVRARRTDVVKPPAMREAVTATLNNIVQQIETRKAQYGGKLPYGTISSIVESHKVNFPWLDVNKVNYHMWKLNAQLPSANRNDTNNISAAQTEPKTEAMPVSNLTEEESDFPQETNAAPYNPLGGHPKGTTNEAYVNLTRRIALAKNEAAEEYLKVREDTKKKKKKLHGVL